MNDFIIEELIKKYPYIKQMTKNTIFLNKDEYDQISNSDTITIGYENISVKFIDRLINDDYIYNKFINYFNKSNNGFYVSYIENGDTKHRIGYYKTTIMKAINELEKNNKITISTKKNIKLKELENSISYKRLLDRVNDETFDVTIDGKDYRFFVKDLYDILKLNYDEFKHFYIDNDYVGDLPSNYFVYAVVKWFKQNQIEKKYIVEDRELMMYKNLSSLDKYDFQSLNTFLKTSDEIYKNIEIDKKLESEILSDLPSYYSDIEKSIYIYIKMCKLFNYDEEYYAVNQKGEAIKKHQDIKYISNINKNNNEIVCYEFNMIYSKLLSKIGINFKSNYKNREYESYGDSHVNIEFRCGKYLIKADSVVSILESDMMHAKLNQPLNGLICINKNKDTRDEFEKIVLNVYKKLILLENGETNDIENVNSLDELLNNYKKLTTNYKDVSLDEKYSILLEKAKISNLKKVDYLSYMLYLRDILFDKEEKNNHFSICIVRDNSENEEAKVAVVSAIIVMNSENINIKTNSNKYYYFNTEKGLKKITKDELQSEFDAEIFEYIDDNDPKIPGIIEHGGLKIC